MTDPCYDTICSIGEMIDKLCVELIKCANANHAILAERRQDQPDPQFIADQEWIARTAGEQRVALKNEINRRIDEAIRRGGINVRAEARTYNLKGI